MIRVQGVSTRYGKKNPEVLKRVDFELPEGCIGVLLGPNGSGKSTMLQCLLGLMKYEGEIFRDGVSLKGLSSRERAKKIAYVPQTLSFAPSSVYDAVMIGRIPHFGLTPGDKDIEMVRETLDELGLSDLAARNVLELSGGERQKVAIARALVQEAKILVFDEPTSNLDIAAEEAILSLVHKLCKEKGLTVLLTMHDLNLALQVGERFILLKGGEVIASGDDSIVNEDNIASAFGVHVERVHVNGKNFIIHGGKEE